jgi:hypothetical protein
MKRPLALFALLAIALSSVAAIPFSFWKTVAVSGLVDPTSISGLKLWLKADALALSDGTAVSSWTDSSGLGNHATQATGANQPILKTSILGGKPVIRFDGANDYLQTATFSSSLSSSTIFAVGKVGTADQTQFVFDGIDSTHRNAVLHYSTFEGGAGANKLDQFAGTEVFGTSTNGVFAEISAVFNGASSATYIDGSLVISGDVGSQSLSGLTVAARYTAANFLAGDLAEIIVYDSALSTANRKNVEQYLASKYTLNSYSLLFNGSSQYVTIPGTPVNVNSDFTIEEWVKLGADNTTNVLFSGSSGSSYWMLIARNDSNGLCFQVDPTGGGATFVGASSSTIAVADAWTHVAVTRSGNTFSFYKNGSLLKTGTYSGTSLATANAQIAHLPIGTNFFNGRVDEVRTWNVARTATEINANKSLVIMGNTAHLTGYWRFQTGSGSTALDFQTNATTNDGTLVSSPTWSTEKPF